MQFAKYINSFIVCFFLFTFSQSAIAADVVERRCGKYFFQIKILNGLDYGETKFELYYREEGKKKMLFYKTDLAVFLYAICMQDKNKKDLMLFKESYGGNSGPEDNFGVFNPSAKKMLIKPSDWPNGNERLVQKLLGYRPPYLGGKGYKSFFCCFRQQYKVESTH